MSDFKQLPGLVKMSLNVQELSEFDLKLKIGEEDNLLFYLPNSKIWVAANIHNLKDDNDKLILYLNKFYQVKKWVDT